jgi:hypothetical protein
MRQSGCPSESIREAVKEQVVDGGDPVLVVTCSQEAFTWLLQLERAWQRHRFPSRPIQEPFSAELASKNPSYYILVKEIMRIMPLAEGKRVGHHWRELCMFVNCLHDPAFCRAISCCPK